MHMTLTGADIFDGKTLHQDLALVVKDGRIEALIPAGTSPADAIRLDGGIIAPGLIDLQVNGSAGIMVGKDTDLAGLAQICSTQRSLGTMGCLPTLITDRPEVTRKVIAAGIEARKNRIEGFLGLHLEGPHLDPRRAGAHDPALIRPMTETDLQILCEAAPNLPALMVTLAPESATPAQIRSLTDAGVIVSLGHSDCDLGMAQTAMAAGANCVTHLFNAMSQLGHRAPGLVGATLSGEAKAGLIADGIHVHPAAMKLALAARPEGIFLVTDCMGFAGTDLRQMQLGGRMMHRHEGRLTLSDGTLAGADLTLPQAIRLLVEDLGIAAGRALAMATSIPAATIGAEGRCGHIITGRSADLVWLRRDWSLGAVLDKGRLVMPDGQDTA